MIGRLTSTIGITLLSCPKKLTGQRAARPLGEIVDRLMRFLTAKIMKSLMTVN